MGANPLAGLAALGLGGIGGGPNAGPVNPAGWHQILILFLSFVLSCVKGMLNHCDLIVEMLNSFLACTIVSFLSWNLVFALSE